MNIQKKIGTLLVIISPLQTHAYDLLGNTFLSPRSQSVNSARELVETNYVINRTCQTDSYNTVSITPEFIKSYKTRRIAQYFFGENSNTFLFSGADQLTNTEVLTFSGSQRLNRGLNDIMADFFGLSPNFLGSIAIEPRVRTYLADISWYAGLDSWVQGLYFRVHAPIVTTEWELKLREHDTDNGNDTPFPANYMSANELQAPVTSITRALQGNLVYGQMQSPMLFGRIDGPQRKSGLSDIQAALGWNFINEPLGLVGFNVRLGIPTGNRSKSIYLFEPMVGNGHHWEVGLGFNSRGIVWESGCDQQVTIFFDINMTHLFKAENIRSFDLKNKGFGSRYMLVKEFDSTGVYNGNILPLINRTTFPCDVSVDFQLDASFMVSYSYCGYEFDFGYNGWARTREIITLKQTIAPNTFGLKGVQDVTLGGGGANNETQSISTLHGSEYTDQMLLADPNSPVFIRPCDISIRSAENPAVLSHKFFTNFGYTWNVDDECAIQPFFGAGGEIEFEGINPYLEEPNKNTLNMWGLWMKGGICF